MRLIHAPLLLGLMAVADATTACGAHSRTLTQAFECVSLNDGIDAALAARGIALDGSRSELETPIIVFGLPVRAVAVFRDGGEDFYTAHFSEAALEQVATAAGIRLGDDRAGERQAANGHLTLWSSESDVALRCTVAFD